MFLSYTETDYETRKVEKRCSYTYSDIYKSVSIIIVYLYRFLYFIYSLKTHQLKYSSAFFKTIFTKTEEFESKKTFEY